jgi:hypothetical protein
MNRVDIENQLLYEFKYLSIETLEKLLDFVCFLRNDARQSVREHLVLQSTDRRQVDDKEKLSLKKLLLQGPTLSAEECQVFEENRKWMELWERF